MKNHWQLKEIDFRKYISDSICGHSAAGYACGHETLSYQAGAGP
jgi:hypothetical protein